jgi:hypothetical protein
LSRVATRVPMDHTVRTGAWPPHSVRRPRRGPLSPLSGATPTNAALCWRLRGPNAGRASHKVRGTLQEIVVVSPHWAGPEPSLEGVVQRGDARLEPGERGRNGRDAARTCPREAMLRRRAHDDALLAAPHKGAQLLPLGVEQRPGRRAAHVRTGGQSTRVHRLRLGPWARGSGNISDLSRVGDHHGQPRWRQGTRHGTLPTTRGLVRVHRGAFIV